MAIASFIQTQIFISQELPYFRMKLPCIGGIFTHSAIQEKSSSPQYTNESKGLLLLFLLFLALYGVHLTGNIKFLLFISSF